MMNCFLNYSVLIQIILELIMRGKTTPEDRIVGVVLARLKKECDFTFHELEVETGIPATTLQGIVGHYTALANPGRLIPLARYFREVHGLNHVDEKYFLTGEAEDQEKIELFREQERIERQAELPPFLELTQEIA
jgi:hypothetical protein